MKIIVLYRPQSEHGRITEDYVRDYKRRHNGAKVEMLNIDRREGAAMASIYDVVQYPTIMALRDDGSVLRSWAGDQLPLMDEIASYSFA